MYSPQYAIYFPVFALFLAVAGTSFTQQTLAATETLIYYDFENDLGEFKPSPAFIDPAIISSDWDDDADALTNFAGNPGRALATNAFVTGNAFTLELTPSGSDIVTFEAIQFDLQASSSGPSNWSLEFDDAEIANGLTATSFASVNIDLSAYSFVESLLLTLSGSGASSDRGNLRLDNFEILGTTNSAPVPLPPALYGFIAALSCLFRARFKASV